MATQTKNDAFVSVVAPVTDAAGTVGSFLAQLSAVLEASFRNYEIVLVENGSMDDTAARIRELQQSVPNVQLYTLNRKSPFDVALVAGLDHSIGDFVFTLDPATDPIQMLPEFFALAQAGNEVVCGLLLDRKSRPIYHWSDKRFSDFIRSTTGNLRVPPGMSSMRLYSRGVLSFMNRNADRHLLLKVLPFFATTKIATVSYRSQGDPPESSRSLPEAIFSGISILLASSVLPLRVLSMLGLVTSSLSLLYAVYVVAVALLKRNVVEGWVSLALPMAVMFFFFSIILSVLAEYIFRMARHTSNTPAYLITSESTSPVSTLQKQLNVVHGDGTFFAAHE